MARVDELQAEHWLIRHTLAALQEALSQAPDVAQDIHQAVVALLEAHLCHEEAAIAPLGRRIQAVRRGEALRDHAAPTVVLRDLNALFAAWRHVPTSLLAVHLTHLIDELRECLDEEEQRVFPIVRHADEDAQQLCRPGELTGTEERGRLECTSVS